MKNVAIPIATGLVLVIAIGLLVSYQTADPEPIPVTETQNTSASETPSTPQASGAYTMADVAQHATAESCWSVINGNVYDLTSWIPEHPGGPRAITQLCGTDGSDKFNNQHGATSRMATVLAGFKIGTLSE